MAFQVVGNRVLNTDLIEEVVISESEFYDEAQWRFVVSVLFSSGRTKEFTQLTHTEARDIAEKLTGKCPVQTRESGRRR